MVCVRDCLQGQSRRTNPPRGWYRDSLHCRSLPRLNAKNVRVPEYDKNYSVASGSSVARADANARPPMQAGGLTGLLIPVILSWLTNF